MRKAAAILILAIATGAPALMAMAVDSPPATTDDRIRNAARPGAYRDIPDQAGAMQATRQVKPGPDLMAMARASTTARLPEATVARVKAAQAKLTPAGRSRIEAEASAVRMNSKTIEQAADDLQRANVDFGNMPIEDAIMIMLSLIAEDARQDTHDMLADMDATRQKKKALREREKALRGQADSVDDMTQLEQVRLQTYMDRRTKAEEMLSNLTKKSSDSSSSIIQNMK